MRRRKGGVQLILGRIIGMERERVEGDKGRYRNREQAIGSCDPHNYLVVVGGDKIGHVF